MQETNLSSDQPIEYVCSECGKTHAGLPMDLSADAPFYWRPTHDVKNQKSILKADTCIIDGKDFFIRAVLPIPVQGMKDRFHYGVWVSLSEKNFKRFEEVHGTDLELKEPPYVGWFSTWLRGYEPTTLNLKARLHFQGGTLRPLVELQHTDHPLSQEFHHGISMHRLHEILQLNLAHKR